MRFPEKTVVVIGATGGLGTAIVSPDKVAGELVKAVDRREKVHIMGGRTTRFFAALNAVSPRLADALVMKRYGATMGTFLWQAGWRGVRFGRRHALGPSGVERSASC